MNKFISKIRKAFMLASIQCNPKLLAKHNQLKDSPSIFIDGRFNCGLENETIVLRPYQKYILDTIHQNRFTIFKMPRQSSKSFLGTSYALHYAIFNDNVNVAIVEHSRIYSRERIIAFITQLPAWCRPEIVVNREDRIAFKNGSTIHFFRQYPGSSNKLRGMNYNLVILDEFGFYDDVYAKQWYNVILPALIATATAKVAVLSSESCKSNNAFNTLYENAYKGFNDFVPIIIHWKELFGNKDNAWKEQMVKILGVEAFRAEYE